MSEQRYTCATDQHELVLGGPDEPGFSPCPACRPYPTAPVDWPARFRAAAEVAHQRGRIVLGEELLYAAQGEPHVVEAIGRALLGGET